MQEELLGCETPSADGSQEDCLLWAVNAFGEVLAELFITPMPLLRFMDMLGFQHLKRLSKASEVMRASMLDVISVSPPTEHSIQSRLEQFVKAPPTHALLSHGCTFRAGGCLGCCRHWYIQGKLWASRRRAY
jgi:hypothetical protein